VQLAALVLLVAALPNSESPFFEQEMVILKAVAGAVVVAVETALGAVCMNLCKIICTAVARHVAGSPQDSLVRVRKKEDHKESGNQPTSPY